MGKKMKLPIPANDNIAPKLEPPSGGFAFGCISGTTSVDGTFRAWRDVRLESAMPFQTEILPVIVSVILTLATRATIPQRRQHH
jgi:hypothetical protein